MNKKWYKLVFKQLQPIHIGMGNYGVINETRIFIPGWTMWGALTKAYNLKNGKNLSENQNVFEEVSCFWPCFDERGENPFLPNFKNGEFYLGNYSEDEFRAKFVDTYVSTAINPLSRMATDESLYEKDVILPGVKKVFFENNEERQLYWTGILKTDKILQNKNVDKKNNKDKKLKIGDKITIGGDSKYGLGLMELINIKELNFYNNNYRNINKSKKEFIDLILSNYLNLCFNDFYNKNNLEDIDFIKSKIELIVEIDNYSGAGFKIKKPLYCFKPGFKIKIDTTKINIDNDLNFEIEYKENKKYKIKLLKGKIETI